MEYQIFLYNKSIAFLSGITVVLPFPSVVCIIWFPTAARVTVTLNLTKDYGTVAGLPFLPGEN